MFSKTFAIPAKGIDLKNPEAVASHIEASLQKDLSGKKPHKFYWFVDTDRKVKKIVFYDLPSPEQVIEFSSIFNRLPEYSVRCEEGRLVIYYFHPDKSFARVLKLNGIKDGVVTSVTHDEEATKEETRSVQMVVSTTEGFLGRAGDISGTVSASVVENADKERRPFFTVKVDDKSEGNRSIMRSCERIHFAWSDTAVSYMIMICRFRMLPPFAISLPLMGSKVIESMELFMQGKKAVGMLMFSDDKSDSFTVENETPTFDKVVD